MVGLGGSATTDGGRGAFEVIDAAGGLGPVELIGACDVDVGSSRRLLDSVRRRERLLTRWSSWRPSRGTIAQPTATCYGVDVRSIEGAGAAGGFGGAIAALGGSLRSGYEVVTELLGFRALLGESDWW